MKFKLNDFALIESKRCVGFAGKDFNYGWLSWIFWPVGEGTFHAIAARKLSDRYEKSFLPNLGGGAKYNIPSNKSIKPVATRSSAQLDQIATSAATANDEKFAIRLEK
jgi:hypothetical protein